MTNPVTLPTHCHVRLNKLERVKNRGAVFAVVSVDLWISGVKLTIDGITVRDSATGLNVSMPYYRHPTTGEFAASLELRPEIGEGIAQAIREEMPAMGVDVTQPGKYRRYDLRNFAYGARV